MYICISIYMYICVFGLLYSTCHTVEGFENNRNICEKLMCFYI